MKTHSSADTGYVWLGGLVMYVYVHSRRLLANCCPSAPRLRFQYGLRIEDKEC
ncbi:MAG: hypothetical protein HDT28_09085 [Clostridiales bacterium]|nr:hypothetical protein [Clostridiales bacterium]